MQNKTEKNNRDENMWRKKISLSLSAEGALITDTHHIKSIYLVIYTYASERRGIIGSYYLPQSDGHITFNVLACDAARCHRWRIILLNWLVIELNYGIFVNLLIMRNGAARLMPMNSIPKYMAHPKAAQVAIIAETLPIRPRSGFDRTTSNIIQVITLIHWMPETKRILKIIYYL